MEQHLGEIKLMVPHNTVAASNTEKNVIKVATKQHQDTLYFERLSIKISHIQALLS